MRIISTSDLMGPDWSFLADHSTDEDLEWSTHSGLRRGAVERLVKRPHLGRIRAAWSAVEEARQSPDALLVSHLPNIGAVTNLLRLRRSRDVPQIAFSFNFTDLPTGLRRRYLSRALRGVSEFVVFSRFEKRFYPDYFDLDPARFRFLPWAMDPPSPGETNPADGIGPYLCAIGGEGRDYALLAKVMRALPHINMVIVARPHSIAGLAFSDNVRVFTNLPLDQTWRIAADSQGLVIPLVSPETACGHITLVGAQLLGIPLVITESRGVEDYVTDGQTAQLVRAGATDALQQAVQALHDDPEAAQMRAQAAQLKARNENSPQQWLAYFQALKTRYITH